MSNVFCPFLNDAQTNKLRKMHVNGIKPCVHGNSCFYPSQLCRFGHPKSFWSSRGRPKISNNINIDNNIDHAKDKKYLISLFIPYIHK